MIDSDTVMRNRAPWNPYPDGEKNIGFMKKGRSAGFNALGLFACIWPRTRGLPRRSHATMKTFCTQAVHADGPFLSVLPSGNSVYGMGLPGR